MILRKPIATCDLPAGGGGRSLAPPLDPPIVPGLSCTRGIVLFYMLARLFITIP